MKWECNNRREWILKKKKLEGKTTTTTSTRERQREQERRTHNGFDVKKCWAQSNQRDLI